MDRNSNKKENQIYKKIATIINSIHLKEFFKITYIEKKNIYPVMVLTLALLDTFILYNTIVTFYYSMFKMIFLHLLIWGIFYCVSKYLKQTVLFFYFVIMLLPSIGFFIFILERIVSYRKEQDELLDEYNKYINFLKTEHNVKEINTHDEINILSLNDHLILSDNDKKKEALIKFITNNTDLQVSVLRKALSDSDSEVVHYAASTLTFLEEKFELIINEKRAEYLVSGNRDALIQIMTYYDKYIYSGLIEGEVKKAYLGKYLDILNEFSQKTNGFDCDLIIRQAHIYMKLNNYEEAEKLLKEVLEVDNSNFFAYFYLMELYFLEKKYELVFFTAEHMKSLQIDIPEEYKKNINAWIEGG